MGLKNTFNFLFHLLVSTEDLPLANLQLALIAILSYLLFMAKNRHLTGLAILDPVHLGEKYPGPLPRCSWMTCKRG